MSFLVHLIYIYIIINIYLNSIIPDITFLEDIYRFSFNNGDATISCFETLLVYAEPTMKGNNAADFISKRLVVWSTATPFVVKGNNIWCVAACGYGSLEKWQQIQRCSFDIEGILPKGPYLPCVSMAGRAILAGYHRYTWIMRDSQLYHWNCSEVISYDINRIRQWRGADQSTSCYLSQR